MRMWIAIAVFLVCCAAIFVFVRRNKKEGGDVPSEVPEHIWDELKAAIPEPDYVFLRTTSGYMGGAPSDLISRLSYIGAAHDPKDPKQVRLAILELRLADQERALKEVGRSMLSEVTVMWLAVISVSGVSSFVAFLFYLLQQIGAVQ